MNQYLVLLIDNNTDKAIQSRYITASNFATTRSLVRQAKSALKISCKHTLIESEIGIKLILHGLTVCIVITKANTD